MVLGLDLRLIPRKEFGIGIAVAFIQLFLYINASAVYGDFAPQAQQTLTVYMLMLALVFGVTGMRPDIVQGGFERTYNFFLMFIATSMLLITIPWITGVGLQNQSNMGVIILQVFAVAYTEEVVFRGILPNYVGDIWSSGAFSIFHWAVYGGSIGLLMFAFILGLFFSVITHFFGLMGAIGAHSAYNLKALGVLDDLMKGAV